MHVALPLLRFSPFNNASALQKRTTRVTRAIDYWIYWQLVVVLVILVVSVATQTQNKSPSLSPSMPSCGTFQCPHEGNTCRRCGPKPQVRHKCIGLPHLGGWNLESPMGIHPCWQAIHIWLTYIILHLYIYIYVSTYDLYVLYVFVLCPEYAKLIQVAVLEDLDHTSITSPNWADLFQSEFIKCHTMNVNLIDTNTSRKFLCNLRCKSQNIHIFFFINQRGIRGEHISPVHPTHAIAGMLSNSKRTHTGCVSSVSCRSCPLHLEVIWKFDATCWDLCSFWLIWLFDVRVLS